MDARIDSAARVAADELQEQINALCEDKEALASQLEAQGDVILGERSARGAAVLGCAEAAAEQLSAHAKEAAMATSAVRSELTRADEAQKAALSDLQFKTQHNMLRLQEGLQRSEEHAEEGLGLLEQHCAHQLQHGLDALGANLEHLLENGIALEAMARSNADASLDALCTSQYDSLESQLLELRASAAASVDELAINAEVSDCMAYLISTIEVQDAKAERETTAARASGVVRRATAFESEFSARLRAADTKHADVAAWLAEEVRQLGQASANEGDALRESLAASRQEIIVMGSRLRQELEKASAQRKHSLRPVPVTSVGGPDGSGRFSLLAGAR